VPDRSATQRRVQRVFGAVTPHVPLSIKRPIKRRIPKRYYRWIDPEWHRWSIGGMWDVLGKLQFDYLVAHGLRPEHYLLDVGCGPLRGGIHFVRYLEPGRYYGVDRDEDKLIAGREVELQEQGLLDKRPTLVVMDDFGFERLRQTFDYALAQSVFTHLTVNQIQRCVMNMEKVLRPGGKFFATFYENPKGKWNLEPVEQKRGIFTHFDRDFFHYDFATFEWIAEGTSLSVENLGDWDNPRNQKMLVFTKRG
jgi:SAM-dependent methyltransferase